MSSLAPAWRTQKPTSRSRKMCRIGFCVAPSRASAASSTADSIHVGSCHVTTSPGPMPRVGQPRGGDLGPVAELGERHRPVVLIDEHLRVGRQRHPRFEQLPERRALDHRIPRELLSALGPHI